MKFKLIKPDCKDVPAYGQTASTGETIELDGHLAEKAERNPDFEAVKPGRKKAATKKAK